MERFRPLKRRVHKRLRLQKKQVEDLSQQAEVGLEKNLFYRFDRLRKVQRFVFGWVLLLLLIGGCLVWQMSSLSAYYQTLQPIPGGIYNEGIHGALTNANPLYATNEVDTSVSRLVFSGLLKHNAQNRLVGDLASYYTVDEKGTTYTVHLKPNLTWQDGQPLTSADVAFTYATIQNPDAQSPLQSSWQGIVVTAVDPLTVTFKLPNQLATFPQNLTNGIVPKHLLGNVAMADMRSASFNTNHPVGSGPFAWQGLQVSGGDATTAQEQIALVPFDNYAGGQPKLSEFIVHAYANQDQLESAFKSGQLTAAAGLPSVPDHTAKSQIHSLLLRAGNYVFFKTTSGVLTDPVVRKALVNAADPAAIMGRLGYTTIPVREPLLIGQLAYDPAYAQQTNNVAAAKTALDQAGWTVGTNGDRSKAGQPLSFTLTIPDTPEYRQVAQMLAQQWQAIGVHVLLDPQAPSDLQTVLSGHEYDAVLYGITIGTDPDVFVYWDSSQADIRSTNRLNFSEYKSIAADTSLEAGRTRLDPALRVVKYKPFLQAWQQDAPALGLYQPRFLYLTRTTVYGLSDRAITLDTDRYANVQNWQIRTANVTND